MRPADLPTGPDDTLVYDTSQRVSRRNYQATGTNPLVSLVPLL